MAAGLPVVISEQCNFPEVATERAGLVVRSEESEVTSAVCTLLADERRRLEAGRNGRRMVMERYTWPAVAAAFADLYHSIIAQSAKG